MKDIFAKEECNFQIKEIKTSSEEEYGNDSKEIREAKVTSEC